MPSGGRLEIAIDRLNERRDVVITVTDSGQGIPADIRDRIFEPFFTTKESSRGTGLGLAMVFGFVNQSGGSISVRSEPGAGSTFEIRLPALERAPDLPPAERDAALPGGVETILLVESDPSVAGFAERALTGMGYRVLRGDGAEAAMEVARAEGGEIDLLVTDVELPGKSGAEVADALRSERRDLPVVYTSAEPPAAAQDAPRWEPVLHKPFTLRELSAVVRRTLDERRPADVMAHMWTKPPTVDPNSAVEDG